MNAHAAKIGVKGRLHLRAHVAAQRLPAAASALDGLLHIGTDAPLAFLLFGCSFGYTDNTLDKMVAVITLQAQ